jgi:hypothetical protein
VRVKGVVDALLARREVLSEQLVVLTALLLPELEQVEGEGAEDGTKLPVWALLVFVKDHVGLEDLA